MERTQDTPTRNDRREEMASLVGEFYQSRSEEMAAQTKANAPSGRFGMALLRIALVVVLTGAAYTAFNPPTAELTQATLEQSARLTIYLANLRIREFRDSSGRMPTSLQEARVDDTGIAYVPHADSTYELTMHVGETKVSYNSTTSPELFLGPAASLIRIR